MWTEQSRGRMAKIAKKTKRYPSDLTDEEWGEIAPLMPKPGRRGRPREAISSAETSIRNFQNRL